MDLVKLCLELHVVNQDPSCGTRSGSSVSSVGLIRVIKVRE